MGRIVMLTTFDNPHSPLDDFVAWNAFDVASGYNTSMYLARILVTSDELSEVDQDRAMEDAVDEIVQENVNGMYRKLVIETDD